MTGVGLGGIDPSVLSQTQTQTPMNNAPPVGPGSPAQDVHGVQESLKDLGYKLDKQEDATDTYGASTQNAVKDFQKDHQLPQTGVADFQTQAALLQAEQQRHQQQQELQNAKDQYQKYQQTSGPNLRGY